MFVRKKDNGDLIIKEEASLRDIVKIIQDNFSEKELPELRGFPHDSSSLSKVVFKVPRFGGPQKTLLLCMRPAVKFVETKILHEGSLNLFLSVQDAIIQAKNAGFKDWNKVSFFWSQNQLRIRVKK